MTRRRKFLAAFLLSLLLAIFFSPPATAENLQEKLARESGAEELADSLDDDTAVLLEEAKEGDWFSLLSSLLQEKLTSPAKTFSLLLSVILLTRLAASLGGTGVHSAADLTATLACAVALLTPLLSLLETAARTVQAASAFLLAAVPVYGGLLIASGFPTAGGTYSTLVLLLANVLPVLSETLLFPALKLFLALGTAASVSSAKLSALTDSLYSFLKWALVSATTVFTAVLSVQTTLNAHADAAAGKAVKLVTSGAVPIVGSAIGDAAAAIYNSVGLVKSTAGAFGILAVLCVFLPSVVSALLWSVCCTALQLAADLLSAPKLSSLFKLYSAAAKLILAVLCAVCAAGVVSAALVLSVGS